MNAQLDRLGGEMLRRAVEKIGLFVRTNTSAIEVIGTDRVEAVRMTTGEVLPADLVVFACGIIPRDEVVQVIEDRKGIYRKLVIRDGKLVGALLVGCVEAAPGFIQIFDRGEVLPSNRLDVLASPGGGMALTADPEVCNCHHVSEGTLVEAIS
jgi:NAD(P)H-nitrite reductase large subunit